MLELHVAMNTWTFFLQRIARGEGQGCVSVGELAPALPEACVPALARGEKGQRIVRCNNLLKEE